MKKAISILVCFVLVFSLAGNAFADYQPPISKIGFKYVNAEKNIDEDIIFKVDAEREAALYLKIAEESFFQSLEFALGETGMSIDHVFTAEEAQAIEDELGSGLGIVAGDTFKTAIIKVVKEMLIIYASGVFTEAQINVLTTFEEIVTTVQALDFYYRDGLYMDVLEQFNEDFTPGDSMLDLVRAIHERFDIAATGYNDLQQVYFIDRTGGDHDLTLSELVKSEQNGAFEAYVGIYHGQYGKMADVEGWFTTVFDEWLNDAKIGDKIPLKQGMNYVEIGQGIVSENGTMDAWMTSLFVINIIPPVISEFELGGQKLTIDQTAKTIKGELPEGTNLNGLKPTVDFTGKTLTPASGAEADFTNAVKYILMADDGSTVEYTVTVTVPKAAEKAEEPEDPIPPTGAEIPAVVVLIFIVSAAVVMLMKRRTSKA